MRTNEYRDSDTPDPRHFQGFGKERVSSDSHSHTFHEIHTTLLNPLATQAFDLARFMHDSISLRDTLNSWMEFKTGICSARLQFAEIASGASGLPQNDRILGPSVFSKAP